MAKKTFILYEKTNPFPGWIRSTGILDDSNGPDGSTMIERLEQLLLKYPDSAYVLLDGDNRPDPEALKYDDINSTLIPLETGDITPEVARKQKQDDAKSQITLSDLAGKTYTEVGTWIDNSITDLQSAKTIIKKMAKIELAIIKRMDLSE